MFGCAISISKNSSDVFKDIAINCGKNEKGHGTTARSSEFVTLLITSPGKNIMWRVS